MKSLCFSHVLISLFISCLALADVSLPLHTLRNQGTTDHCWAYSMSHLLESRALTRESSQVLIYIEKDVKYWVDYERMMFIHRTKNDFFLGDYEGGWQIEFFETLLKHGKNVYSNVRTSPQVSYRFPAEYLQAIDFMPASRAIPDSKLPNWGQVAQIMKTKFKTNLEAHNFAIDYLNRRYGMPQSTTVWNNRSVPIQDSARHILGSDYNNNRSVGALVLVKPVTDGQHGWTPYLQNRYWGYRYDRKNILGLIELSLDNKWPVTFDNVYHAMTIIAYRTVRGAKHYAVADSIPGKITWYTSQELVSNLNLVTFFRQAIPNALPPRTNKNLLKIRLPMNTTLDQYDNVSYPPR